MINSRNKGKRGELMLARALREYGFACRRGQQYSGANGDPDVLGLPGIHVECKYVEHLNLHDAVAQAIHDARSGEMPVVFHRKNHTAWLVTLQLPDFMKLYSEYASSLLMGERDEE